MENLKGYLISFSLLSALCLGMGCGGEKSPATQKIDQPQTSSSSEIYNHINGNWKFTKAPHLETVVGPLNDPSNQLLWKINSTGEKKSQGVLEYTRVATNGQSECRVQVNYSISYCCAKMRKAFFKRTSEVPTENPTGCVESTLNLEFSEFAKQLQAQINQDYQFTYFPNYTPPNQLKLEGPFVDPTHAIELTRWVDVITTVAH